MKNLIKQVSFGLIVLTSFVSQRAKAVDIDQGADALFSQIRSSKLVLSAQVRNFDGKTIEFTNPKAILGRFQESALKMSLPAEYTEHLKIKAGKQYLLFLNQIGLAGRTVITPAMSFYSLQELSDSQVSTASDLVSQFSKYLQDKAALKKIALDNVLQTEGYLQYSMVSDMMNFLNATSSDVKILADYFAQGKIKEPRAQSLIIEGVGRFNLRNSVSVLENVIRSQQMKISMKLKALNALHAMGAKEAIRNLTPELMKLRSSKIEQRLGEIANPRN